MDWVCEEIVIHNWSENDLEINPVYIRLNSMESAFLQPGKLRYSNLPEAYTIALYGEYQIKQPRLTQTCAGERPRVIGSVKTNSTEYSEEKTYTTGLSFHSPFWDMFTSFDRGCAQKFQMDMKIPLSVEIQP